MYASMGNIDITIRGKYRQRWHLPLLGNYYSATPVLQCRKLVQYIFAIDIAVSVPYNHCHSDPVANECLQSCMRAIEAMKEQTA